MKIIDDFLNNITMYRLVFYGLLVLLGFACFLTLFNKLPFDIYSLIFTASFITFFSWITNKVFARIFKAVTNFESIYISALILSLIIQPTRNFSDLLPLFALAILSQGSKYILAINKKHIFNPAAFALCVSPFLINLSPSWWIGNPYIVIPTFLLGLLIVRKIQRWDLVLSFFATFSLMILFTSFLKNDLSFTRIVFSNFLSIFFAFVMLTEPQTTPPKRTLRMLYGGLVGLIFGSNLHLGPLYTTPEMSLVLGNIFSFLVSPKEKLFLSLKEKVKIGSGIYDFIFEQSNGLKFLPGQYMEWTLDGTEKIDMRGVRRYFTLASSPTEGNLRIGVRFSDPGSSFKRELRSMNSGDKILAGSLSGEFTLPKNKNEKLCFIAGGIGITPFRSMIKYLLDTNEKRDIVLFYSVKTQTDAVYKDIFKKAESLGIKSLIWETDKQGVITEKWISQEVPDYRQRQFYLSGPHSMVDSFKETLKKMGVSNNQIKVDFFPGYA